MLPTTNGANLNPKFIKARLHLIPNHLNQATMDTFIKHVKDFEERIGIRLGFFNELIREEDWSFIIKLHAFLEACLTNTICSVLGHPELESIISRLDTANSQFGKIAFAKKLNLLKKAQRRFLVTLSELRNNLAHNVRSVEFSFERHMKDMPEEQLYQFCTALSLDEMFIQNPADNSIRIISFVHDTPKFGITYSASIVASELYLAANTGDLNKDFKLIGKHIFEEAINIAFTEKH